MNLNNIKIIFFLVLKFFFLRDGGKFRKSYFFQITGIYMGSLIISLTLSIMTGLEYEIFNKIKAFNYKYMISEDYIDLDNYDLTKPLSQKEKEEKVHSENL